MADITYNRPEYEEAAPRWRMVSDACAGQHAVAAGGYLVRPNPSDKTPAAEDRWLQYQARAVYYNATGRTKEALTGIAYRRWPEIVLPDAMNGLLADVDGTGRPLIQQSQGALSGLLETGRGVLLTDFPAAGGVSSKDALARDGIRSTITHYGADALVNWRTGRVGNRYVLTLAVLTEQHEEEDGYGTRTVEQRRELALEDGVYVHRLHRKLDGRWAAVEEVTPKKANGQPWRELPLIVLGATANGPDIGPIPLYDIATLNLAHYRNSADYEDSAYICGQPQVWVAGLDETWRDELYKQGAYIGSRSVLALPQGGTAGIMQAQPNTLAREAMQDKEQQMAALGARMLHRGEAVKTATQQDSEDAAAHSVLSLCCDNVSAGYTKALQFAQEFEGASDEVDFAMSTEFVTDTLDPAVLRELLAAVQAGHLPQTDLWAKFREWNLIDPSKDDEMVRDEIEGQGGAVTLDDDGEAGTR